MEPASLVRQVRMDSLDSSCSNRTRSIASLGGSEDSILEEQTPNRSHRTSINPRQLSDGFSPDELDSGFNSNTQLESSPNNGSLRCRTPDIKSPRSGQEDSDDIWLPRFPRARKLGGEKVLGTSGSLGSTDSWIENSVSEEDEDVDEGDMARCLTSMSMGSGVIKVKGSGRCAVKTLYLDGNKSCVRWRPSKKGNKAKISIESIKEIREGPNTDSFKKYLATGSKCRPKTCFSIIHGSSWDTFNLISDTEEETAIWIRGLKHLLKGVRSEVRRLNNNKLRDCWLRATFEAADKSGDGLLSMDEVLKLLHKLNVSLSKRKVKQLFKEADSQDDNIGKLDFDEFIHFYRTISTRQEVDLLLRDYGHAKGYITLEEFATYLRDEQGMGDVELDLCQELVQTYEPIPENSKNGWMGIDGFTRYLLSHEGNIFNPAHREVTQDMTRPLTHYYIASSHNTYLVGDQLMSQSSVDVYALVLQAGCRCVEMDCWDGKDGEPIIYHGYTLTSKIKFRDVISIISKYAFVTSPYPVILSIENHCSLEQQKKMAQYLVEILGGMLHIPAFDPMRTPLPSPEELKGKILIKAKKLPEDHNENLEAGEVSEEDSADELDEDLKLERSSITKKFESVAMAQLMLMRKKPITPTRSAWQRIISKVREDSRMKDANSKNHARSSSLTGTLRRLKLSKKKPKSQSSSESSEGGSLDLLEKSTTDEETVADHSSTCSPKSPSPQPTSRSHKGKSIVLCRQLSQLVQLTRSVGFRGFKSTMASWELPSLGEMRASNLVATKAPDFTQFTGNHLCRVYPSAYRIDSSNYNPQPMWNCGCQLVALNYQTEGRPMQLSRAKFSLNGNCGYTLKHPLLCDASKPFDPNSGDPIPHLPKKQLTLHVISGQQLPKPPQSLLGERGEIIDPYVEVEVIGLPVDCAKSQTRTVQDNGFNPFWDCTMTFTVHLPEMALIRFAVWDEDPIGRDFIGQATFPVSSLMPGYRHVHLEGLDQATLFVHVTMEDYNTWVNNTARFKPRGSQCRTKSVELEYSPLSSSPTHRQSPRRKSSLGLVQKLNMRRRHSMAALPPRELSPLPTGTRMKRRSYEDGHMTGSAGELRQSGEVLSENYLELTLCSTDTAVDLILDSPIQSRLEADGTYCISVDDLPAVLALNIPSSALFEAIQKQKLSLRSGESYTAVERSFMVDLLTEKELECSLDNCETESLVSAISYEEFVQHVFEDCLSPDLTYDPCPDLLKEASPVQGTESAVAKTLENPGDIASEKSSPLDQKDSSSQCRSGLKTIPDAKRDCSDEDSDDVFLPDACKQDNTSRHLAVKDQNCQKVANRPGPPPVVIPNPSPNQSPSRSPSSSLSSPLLTPTSPQLHTFTRGTMERRSRIIYDDTAEFVRACVDSQVKHKSVDDTSVLLEPKHITSMSISTLLLHEFDTMLNKYEEEAQNGSNDAIVKASGSKSGLINNRVIPTSDTSVYGPDLISDTPSNACHSNTTEEKGSTSNDIERCDNCNDSDISSTDYESDTSSNLPKRTSQDFKSPNTTLSEKRDAEITTVAEINPDERIQTKASPPSLQKLTRFHNNSSTGQNQTTCDSETSQADDRKQDKINTDHKHASMDSRPAIANDKNNNEKFLLKMQELRLQQPKIANLKTSLQPKKKTNNTIKTDVGKHPQWINGDDRVDSDDTDDSDIDDTSSSASSSSIASSTSSSNTVVEVPSFASVPDNSPSSPSKTPASLSPLKLEDIFDPSECQQFRSELVQRWQKSNLEDDSIGDPSGSTHRSTSHPSQSLQSVSDNVLCREQASPKHPGNSCGKRLSWPLRMGKNISTENVPDRSNFGRNNLNHTGRLMLQPVARDTNHNQLSSWLVTDGHHFTHPEVVYRSHLSPVRLSNLPTGHVSATSKEPTGSQIPPSYHDHVKAYKKSNSLPSSLTRTPLADKFPKKPPSYEDHISKYGLPSKFQPSPTNSSHKQAPSLKLWRAEPVTISEVRTIQLHSAQDIFEMRQNLASSHCQDSASEPEILPWADGIDSKHGQGKSQSARKQRYSTGSCTASPSSRTVQFHPTPPRRRKKMQRSYSDEGTALINSKLVKNGKNWPLNSGKNHNIYLMLTL